MFSARNGVQMRYTLSTLKVMLEAHLFSRCYFSD